MCAELDATSVVRIRRNAMVKQRRRRTRAQHIPKPLKNAMGPSRVMIVFTQSRTPLILRSLSFIRRTFTTSEDTKEQMGVSIARDSGAGEAGDLPTGLDVMEQNRLVAGVAAAAMSVHIRTHARSVVQATHPANRLAVRCSPSPSANMPRRLRLCFAWSYAQICDVDSTMPRTVVASTPR